MRQLKSPNHRQSGISSVYETSDLTLTRGRASNAIVKVQQGYVCRPVWSLFQAVPVVRRERRALLALNEAGVNVPAVLDYHEDLSGAATLVTTKIEAAPPMDEALASYPQHAAAIVRAVAREVGHLHASGWVHGALYPGHILIRSPQSRPEAFLIDLEKARRSLTFAGDLERFWRYAGFPDPELCYCFEEIYQAERCRAAARASALQAA